MPLKCFEKPNRKITRFWTAEKVGQVACIALKQGHATRAQIETEIAKCASPDRKRSSEALEALQQAEVALEANNEVLDADARSLNQFLALPLFGAIVLRLITRIPVAGPVLAVGLPLLREVATARIRQITVQKAANDRAIDIVRRAAANEARFLRTGT